MVHIWPINVSALLSQLVFYLNPSSSAELSSQITILTVDRSGICGRCIGISNVTTQKQRIHTHVWSISVYVLTLLIFHHNRRCHFKYLTFMAVGYQKSVIQMPLEFSQYDLQMPELISFAKEIVVRKFDEIKKLTQFPPVQFEAICVNCSRC